MPIVFKGLQDEVKRRATRDQGGTQFDTAIKNIVNFSLFRIARELPWRSLRRKYDFTVVGSYTKGTGYASATSNNSTVNVLGATFQTDQIQIKRKVKFSGSGTYYFISQISGETSMVLDNTFQNVSASSMTYEILPQEEYVLPIQAGHRMFMWHEAFGYPFKMNYITDQDFYQHGVYLTVKNRPTHYRMWGEDMALKQLTQPSVLTVNSSSSLDITTSITIFGTVSGYPDYETIALNTTDSTTTVPGTKIFTSVERLVKDSSTIGRVTITANAGVDTVAVIPVGDTTSGIRYRKVQLYPLPSTIFPVHVQYYKDPYRLVNDKDVHELGEEFDEAIILLATAKLKAEQNLQTEADRMFSLYQEEIQSLKRTNIDKLDWYPGLRRPRQMSSDGLVAANLLYRQCGGTGSFGPASRF